METITSLGDQWIQTILNIIRKNQEKCLLVVSKDYSNNYSELFQSSRSVSVQIL